MPSGSAAHIYGEAGSNFAASRKGLDFDADLRQGVGFGEVQSHLYRHRKRQRPPSWEWMGP